MSLIKDVDARIPIIIPARSGSVGIKDKNIKPLGDKPLLAWAIDAAKGSELADRVIVDTDSEQYAMIARGLGAETPYLRPKELAEDVPTEDVLIHAVRTLRNQGYDPSIIVVCQCTTPFITSTDIDNCIGPVLSGQADSAITVAEVSERPEWMFAINDYDGNLRHYTPYSGDPYGSSTEGLKGEWGIRQTHPKLFRPNGGVYAVKTEVLFEKRQIIFGKCKPVLMSRLKSFDIDSPEDFLLLEALVKAGYWEDRQ